MGKPTMWLFNRSDTNQTVQAQKIARGLNIRFRKRRNCTICVAKTKGADQFFCYCDFDVRLFSHMQIVGFPMRRLI